MKFPLYHRPSALVFLDDETPYLEMLAIVLPRDWCIRFHTRTRDYLAQIQAQSHQWEDDVGIHQDIINQWYRGKALPNLILDYWRSQSLRYGLPSTAVVDYAMPAANGLEVIKSSPAWPTHRILLTGRADEHTAVAAFNDGLINRYVTKQSPDLVAQLTHALRQHMNAPLDFYQGMWRNILRRDQLLALQDRAVQLALTDWLKANHCVEHVIFPEPFGMLCLDATGHAHWLQFEMYKDLPLAVEVAKAAGLNEPALQAMARGQMLSDLEWLHALRSDDAAQTAPALSLGTGGHLIAAHFAQTGLGLIGMSHHAFLAIQPERGVDLD